MRALAATALLLLITPDRGFSCSHLAETNPPVTQSLANGVTITVRSVEGSPPAQACEVSVKDRSGREIFADRGFGASINPATGRDIDNDGRPDAVVGIDTGGRKDCCWDFAVISFSPMPRVLLKLPAATFDFDTKPGSTLVWTSANFTDLNPTGGDSPIVVATAHEFQTKGFIDVTLDFCKPLLLGEIRGLGTLREPLATLTRKAKQDSRTETGRQDDLEYTRFAAVTVILQQIYCGQFDEASRTILEVWPGKDQSRIRTQIRTAVAGRWPELAKRLDSWN